MKLSQRIMNYWSKQLEYTRDDTYPNGCRNFSVTVRSSAPIAQSAPLYEIARDGSVVRASITVRGLTRIFEG